MKGNPKLLDALNGLLADELTAINQYIVHAEMCDNWGYERLHQVFQGRARAEMKHAEKLIGRILFLQGAPVVSKLNLVTIGPDVPKMFDCDLAAEMTAVRGYNLAIQLATEVQDAATREMLESILAEEDGHVSEIEAQQDQLRQVGAQVYLGQQIRS